MRKALDGYGEPAGAIPLPVRTLPVDRMLNGPFIPDARPHVGDSEGTSEDLLGLR
jgi:hypothetical protein